MTKPVRQVVPDGDDFSAEETPAIAVDAEGGEDVFDLGGLTDIADRLLEAVAEVAGDLPERIEALRKGVVQFRMNFVSDPQGQEVLAGPVDQARGEAEFFKKRMGEIEELAVRLDALLTSDGSNLNRAAFDISKDLLTLAVKTLTFFSEVKPFPVQGVPMQAYLAGLIKAVATVWRAEARSPEKRKAHAGLQEFFSLLDPTKVIFERLENHLQTKKPLDDGFFAGLAGLMEDITMVLSLHRTEVEAHLVPGTLEQVDDSMAYLGSVLQADRHFIESQRKPIYVQLQRLKDSFEGLRLDYAELLPLEYFPRGES